MNLKKIVAIVLMGMTLTACTETSEDKNHGLDSENPTTITLGTLEDTSLQNMVETFNTTVGNDRGINIEYKPVTSTEELATMDMVSTDYDTIYSLCSSGNVAELSNYFSAMDLGSNYLETSIESISLSGLRAIPTKLDINVLVLNNAEWESFASANGLDTSSLNTWDSILTLAETYYNTYNGKPFLSVNSGYDVALEMSYQASSPLAQTSKSGATINITEDTMRNLWDNISMPQIKGLITNGGYESVQNGDVLASYCPLSEVPKDADLLVLKAPLLNDSLDMYKLDTTAIAINSTDDKTIYASVQFVKWLTSSDVNYMYALNDGCIPVNKDCQSPSNMKDYLYNGDTSANSIGTLLAVDLITNNKVFKVSPFDNVSVLKSTFDSKVDQTTSHETVKKRIQGGILESKAYEGILDASSFKTWYDDLCEQLKITFNAN